MSAPGASIERIQHPFVAERKEEEGEEEARADISERGRRMIRFADPQLLCFQHCRPETRLFCLEVPDACPVCGLDIRTDSQDDMLTKAFPVPCPFVSASDAKSSILIRPTKGDFLQ